MRQLIRFFLTYKTLFLFILLEVVALALIVNHSRFQRVHFLNSSNVVTGTLYKYVDSYSRYFSLNSVNDGLTKENAILKEQVARLQYQLSAMRYDSTFAKRSNMATANHYSFRTARVIQSTTTLTNNFLTIDKGLRDGVKVGMGVINHQGVVGIICNASQRFAVVIPIINEESRINAKVDGKSENGTLLWSGRDCRFAQLEEVPNYINVKNGDMIKTSSASSIFPEGLTVGEIVSFKNEKDNFYSINVKLAVDFNNLSYVDVIEFRHAEEKKQLEEEEEKDE